MRVALVHDYLNQYGGAERVLEAFCEMFPEAPIYTLFYDKEKTFGKFEGKKIITSFLDMNWVAAPRPCGASRNDREDLMFGGLTSRKRLNLREGKETGIITAKRNSVNGTGKGGGIIHKFIINNHRLFIPLMPLAASLMKVSDDYDVVLSSSAGYGKGIRCGKNAIHISYCHTPLRYAWEQKHYLRNVISNFSRPRNAGSRILDRLCQSGQFLISKPILNALRWWDYRAGQKPQKLIANSKYISEKIKNYYKRKAEVIYPPVDTEKFCIKSKVKKGDYFLAVGRLIHYKKFDLIIRAFNKLNLPLLVVGNGPELNSLKKLAQSPKIKFLGIKKDKDLNVLYNSAKALIFPQAEDFGLVAAEAQACGLPVIALNEGGAKEIVIDEKTGILFNNQTVDDLISAIEKFQIKSFNREEIGKSALRFSKNNFKEAILKVICHAQDARK